MDSTLRTVLILILFGVITVILFKPCYVYGNESVNKVSQKEKFTSTSNYDAEPALINHDDVYHDRSIVYGRDDRVANAVHTVDTDVNGKPLASTHSRCLRPDDGQTDTQVFSDKIHDDIGQVDVSDLNMISTMGMSDDEINTMIAMRPHIKTYLERDGSNFSSDNLTGVMANPETGSNIHNIVELANVVDNYRNRTLESITGGNYQNLTYPTKTIMYNRLI